MGMPLADGKLAVLFTNHEQGDMIADTPLTVQGVSLTQVGMIVMLTGEYSNGTLNNAQLVEAAGPLLSFAIKSSMGGGDDQPQQPQKPAAKPPARR